MHTSGYEESHLFSLVENVEMPFDSLDLLLLFDMTPAPTMAATATAIPAPTYLPLERLGRAPIPSCYRTEETLIKEYQKRNWICR